MSEGSSPSRLDDGIDHLRAQWYRILAGLLARPPQADELSRVAHLLGDESDFGKAVDRLAAAAREADPESVRREYFDLFIGVGRGELVPFASFYLTGFLHERPLANLRQDMAAIGAARTGTSPEPEDHIASILDLLAGQILGEFAVATPLEAQQTFFDRHIGSWAARFFEDLEAAENARFYKTVGGLGRRFVEIERQAFEMAA